MKDRLPTTIYNLGNAAYHYGEPYREYLSSTQLKWLAKSPRHFRHMLDHPDEEAQTPAQAFGSLFHDLMAATVESRDLDGGIAQWRGRIAIFEPPVNDKTGQPYGAATKAYKEAYDEFAANSERLSLAVTDEATAQVAVDMAEAVWRGNGGTSELARRVAVLGRPEVSHFAEYEGLRFKYRPDVEIRLRSRTDPQRQVSRILDWKTIADDDLNEDALNRAISRYGYDISAAFYQFFHHELTGEWPEFWWVFVSTQPPHDCVVADARRWAYDYDEGDGTVMAGIGAMKFRALLDKYVECARSGEWPGPECRVAPAATGRRLMVPEPPAYENYKPIIFY